MQQEKQKKLIFYIAKTILCKKKGKKLKSKEELIKILATTDRYISQKEAADALQITPAQVSLLIKKGILPAYMGGKRPKPYVSGVLNYKPQPNKKRYKTSTTTTRKPDGTITSKTTGEIIETTMHPNGKTITRARTIKTNGEK